MAGLDLADETGSGGNAEHHHGTSCPKTHTLAVAGKDPAAQDGSPEQIAPQEDTSTPCHQSAGTGFVPARVSRLWVPRV